MIPFPDLCIKDSVRRITFFHRRMHIRWTALNSVEKFIQLIVGSDEGILTNFFFTDNISYNISVKQEVRSTWEGITNQLFESKFSNQPVFNKENIFCMAFQSLILFK